MHKLNTLALGLALAFGAAQAQADTVVDTGTPNGVGFAYAIDGNDWLAGQFSLTATQTQITSINWYLDGANNGDTFTVAVYGNAAGNRPDTSNELFSGTATYTATGWNGLSGLNWNVGTAGTYWAAVEVQASDNFSSFTAPVAAPNPLTTTAFNAGSGYTAYPMAIGLQVTAVPEADSAVLLLAGMGLVGLLIRRKA